jgi:putative ABC transport system permease protein
VNIGVRTARDPGAMARSIAAAVHSVDPQVAVAHVRTMDQVKSESLAEDRFTMLLFAAFAFVALLLAAVGIYALMAFAVSQRTQEIGLRLALGSGKGRVISLVLRDASMLAVTGLVLGLAGAALIGRIMRSTLYEVGAMDVWVLLTVGIVLLLTALLASYLPARRAASIDPMKALRTE